jgi:glycine hydroxymethyltransferase
MGAFDLRGPGAAAFLDIVTTNDVPSLSVGESHYTYFLDVDGQPLDDLMIYKLAEEHFLIVVNASNNDKNWAWLNAVKSGEVAIDRAYPARRASGTDQCELRDLRAASSGPDQRLDIALQGPESLNILQAMTADTNVKTALKALAWAGVTRVTLENFDLIVSRTGYTGERTAFELFVHPDQAAALFERLIELGAVPCGLAARDSLRTEFGLPLYGHELAGDLALNPADAGFANYVKVWKPFFVGKAAFIAHEQSRDAEVARIRLEIKGARPAHPGDPVVDKRGRVVGIITSCSIDSEGFQSAQVYLKDEANTEGTVLAVWCGSQRSKPAQLARLSLGARVGMPEPAIVLSRYAKLSKK